MTTTRNENYLEGFIVELTPTESVTLAPDGLARMIFDGSNVLLSVNGGPFIALGGGGGALGPALSAINALVPAADSFAYYTGPAAAALATITAQARALLDDATAADQRTTLGLGTSATEDTGVLANQIPVRGVGGSLDATDGVNTITIDADSVSTDAPTLTIDSANTINLQAPGELQINGLAGAATDVLTSQGPGLPPVWAPAGAGGGPWTLVQTQALSGAASVSFAGLDGDADEIYWVEGELTMTAGGQVQIAPNANAGFVCDGSWLAINSGGGAPATGSSQKILFPASTTLGGTSRVSFWVRIDAQSRAATLAQLFQWQAITRFQGPITFQTLIETGGNSYDGAPANLTSLDVVGVGGTMTGDVSLYKLAR